ncbi:CHRD domain-containing protein [Schlegelella sp. ID0723]|uniref:CHRD domain-containing protein n=2 Tax=Piscinibacter koreensis TaxID=2742824 RepID=A0A7Y6TVZ5_9BURK|nr:CHRD domain-containing protein [Schlegelella koreensis]
MSNSSSAQSEAASKVSTLAAQLSGTSEVPPVKTGGAGFLTATYEHNTRTLTWAATYSGLSGPATAAHFHGPAEPGQNAGVVVPFPSAASPIQGTATLTPAQEADLLAGRWYVNVHTAQNPGGEIRGQVKPL